VDVDGNEWSFFQSTDDSPDRLRSSESVGPRRSLRVLIADDSTANQLIVERLLRSRGHQTVIAENGRDAVQAASRQSFDIVLMDVQMPEMDGLEATRRIRRAGRQPSIPIVAFTGYHGGAEREKCFSAGMTAYLAKPVDRRTLIEMLEGLCDPT
jgi:two-component system, sensor histidine kinase and response regulator